MTHPTLLEDRVAALISAYADRAPTDLDPIAMTRIVIGTSYGDPPRLRFRSVGLWVGFAAVVMAVLVTVVVGALVAGGQPVRRDPLSVIADPVAVVAQYGKIHWGFVFVYSDGRVVLLSDGSQTLLERRLTQEGIDLVRSGAADPRMGVPRTGLAHQLPASAWADTEFAAYEPPGYAVCQGDWDEPIDASRVASRLPLAAQALLRGKERTYDKTDAGLGAAPPLACFEMTAEAARILVGVLADAGFETDGSGPQPTFLEAGSFGGYMSRPARSGRAPEANRVSLMFQPILPHGTWVMWGG
jgi:hypothetical protein